MRCYDWGSCANDDATQPFSLTATISDVYIDDTNYHYEYVAKLPDFWTEFDDDVSANAARTGNVWDDDTYNFWKLDGEYKLVADADGQDREWDSSTLPNGAFKYWTCASVPKIPSFISSTQTFDIPDASSFTETFFISDSDYMTSTVKQSPSTPYSACSVTYSISVIGPTSDATYYTGSTGALDDSSGSLFVANDYDLGPRTYTFTLTATHSGGS